MKQLKQITGMLGAGWQDYIIYAAIILVTLIGLTRCLIPLWRATRSVRRAIHRLQHEKRVEGQVPVWQQPGFMGRRLSGPWLRFLQNAEQLDRRGLPCSVEDYINDDTVCHGPGNATLAELIPSLLTSLGILGTFMGLTAGLTGLDMSSSESLMTGVPLLLDGMRFAFGTSVAGVSCSLAFNMLNRIAQGSSYRAIDDFTETFTTLAMQRPLDNDVQMICQNQDRNKMLYDVTGGISETVGAAVQTAVTRAMTPVSRSMDNFLANVARNQTDGLARIVDNFVRQMHQSLSNQLLVLGQTLSDVNQSQRLAAQQVQDTLNAAGGLNADLRSMQTVIRDILNGFEGYTGALREASGRNERTMEAMDRLVEKLRRDADAQTDAMTAVADCSSRLRALLAAMPDKMDAPAFRQAVVELNGNLDIALTNFTAAMTDTLDRLEEHIDSTMADDRHSAAETLSRLETLLSAMEGHLKCLAEGKED